jgi:hypothetical protein
VKRAFRKRFRDTIEDRIREVTRGSYMEFLLRMLREL